MSRIWPETYAMGNFQQGGWKRITRREKEVTFKKRRGMMVEEQPRSTDANKNGIYVDWRKHPKEEEEEQRLK